MAATNPFRVSDLVAKYGWQAMIYMSNLGIRSLAEAQVLFVDSGHTNALDADDTEHGHSFEKPLATVDYANSLLTADEGGIILSAPGHSENIGTGETIDFDVAGVTYVSLGNGTLRARFDFDAANSAINVAADNVTLVNFTIRPGYADVLIGIDIEQDVTNTRIVDCECLEGEANTDEFLATVELKAGCHDTVIENNVFRADWSSHPDDGISLNGASDRVTIRKNRFSGPYGDVGGVTAAISNSSGVCMDLLIEDNVMKVKDGESGIEVISTTPAIIRKNLIISSTTATIDELIVATIGELDQNIGIITDGTSGEFIGGGAISPEVVQYNLDHLAKTDTLVAADADISGIVVAGSILGHIMSTDADPANFNASTDSLQSIATAIGLVGSPTDVTDIVAHPPDAGSLQDILNKDTSYTYDKAKHSLEMCAENLSAAIGSVTAGSVMDIVKKLYYAADGGSTAFPTTIANDSALAKIMVKGTPANIDQFDNTTDSLEAIADAVTGFTTAVSQTPTARSVQDILEKNNSGSFVDATDSLEAISDCLRLAIGDVDTPAAGSALDILKKLYYAADGSGKFPATVVNDSALAKIMSKADPADASSFENDTDSLEAIRDNQQAAARAAIDDAELDHLCELDGTAAYAENIANDSIIAKIMCVGATATANTFDNTEDSLQAISEFVRTGTTLGEGIQLDHLLKTSTTVAMDDDLTTYVADLSVMAHVMSKTAVGSSFDASTDSLEAIAAALAAGTGCNTVLGSNQLDTLAGTATGVAADADLNAHCVDQSLLSHICSVSADITTFKPTTDSLEGIRNHIEVGTTALGGINLDHFMKTAVVDEQDMSAEIADGSALAHILVKAAGGDADDFDPTTDSLEAISDKVTAVDTIVDMGTQTLKVAGVALTGGDVDVFTVATGPVKIKSLFFIIATATDVNSKVGFSCTPTAGSETDLTPTVASGVELNGAADAGDIVYSEMDNTIMIIADTDGTAMPKVPEYSQIVPIGSINLVMENASPNSGAADVYVQWEPLAPGATLTATP